MLRVAMSVVAVLLIAAFSYLLFSGYFHGQQQSSKDLLGTPLPPAAPVMPAPPIQPVVHQPPVAPVPAPVPVPAPAPVVERPAAPESRARRTHVVQSGDSLSSISQKYFNTPNYYGKIAAANGLKNKDRIRVGQVLVLPDVAAAELKPIATPSEDAPVNESRTDDLSTSVDLKDFEPMPPTLSVPRPAPKK